MAHISFVLSLHRFHHICNITLHCVLAVVDVGVAIGVVDDVGIAVDDDDDDAGIGFGFFDDDDVVFVDDDVFKQVSTTRRLVGCIILMTTQK